MEYNENNQLNWRNLVELSSKIHKNALLGQMGLETEALSIIVPAAKGLMRIIRKMEVKKNCGNTKQRKSRSSDSN